MDQTPQNTKSFHFRTVLLTTSLFWADFLHVAYAVSVVSTRKTDEQGSWILFGFEVRHDT